MEKITFLVAVVAILVGLMCYFITKIAERIINLIALRQERKSPGTLPRSEHIVFNKKRKKLEEDNRVNLPFE